MGQVSQTCCRFSVLQALVQGRRSRIRRQAGGADTLLHYGSGHAAPRRQPDCQRDSRDPSRSKRASITARRISLVPNVYGDHALPANGETISNLNVHGDLVGWIRERAGRTSERRSFRDYSSS